MNIDTTEREGRLLPRARLCASLLTAFLSILPVSRPCHAAASAFRPTAPESHRAAFSLVQESGEQAFRDVLKEYEAALRSHPDDVRLRIELCRFLDEVRDEEDQLEDSAAEALDRQIGILTERYPDDRLALVYRASLIRPDSAIALLEGYLGRHEEDSANGTAWDVFEQLAISYDGRGETYKALHYGAEAMRFNDTLDLTALVAEQCEKEGDTTSALAYLRKFKDKPSEPWVERNKGDLFLRLGDRESAITAFRRALEKDEWPGTLLSLATSLEKAGKLEEARASILKAHGQSYFAEQSARALFLFDLHHSVADSAYRSYNTLRDEGFRADPLARHRLALFLAYPRLPWHLRDIGALFLLIAFLALWFLVPGAIVVPIHYAGLVRKVVPPAESRWTLKHFWIMSSLFLTSGFLAMLVFEYDAIADWFRAYAISGDDAAKSDLAGSVITETVLFALCCLAFVRRGDILKFWGSKWPTFKSVISGAGWMLVVNVVFVVAVFLFLLFFHPEGLWGSGHEFFKPLRATRNEYLVALREQGGAFWFLIIVAIVGPVCEELLFRGAALRSFQRYLPFGWANLVQAVLFGLAHGELVSGLHAFLLGLVAGVLRHKSASLGPALVLHISNNLLAATVILGAR